jgi:hypothetical protein
MFMFVFLGAIDRGNWELIMCGQDGRVISNARPLESQTLLLLLLLRLGTSSTRNPHICFKKVA